MWGGREVITEVVQLFTKYLTVLCGDRDKSNRQCKQNGHDNQRYVNPILVVQPVTKRNTTKDQRFNNLTETTTRG